ncbi:MAG: hypothetical protein AAFV53_32570 [Myxococcota bacterium]
MSSGAEGNLKSWVRTLPEPEAMTLLDLARPGVRLELWRQEADATLTQEDASYRTLLIKMVERMMLDHDGERILDSRYLWHFQNGWPAQRMDLFLARYGLAHPWTALAGRELLLPALSTAEARDAPEDAGFIELSDVDAFVARHIDPNIGESSRKKTRSTIVGLFRKIGNLEQNGSSRDPLQVRRTQPTPLAFGWVVAQQLRQTPDQEVTEQWAASHSKAMALFTPTDSYAERCVEAAVTAGLLKRPLLSVGLTSAS